MRGRCRPILCYSPTMAGVSAQASLRRFAVHANVALPGLYAWVTTVTYPGAGHQAELARATAYGALAALLVGALLVQHRPRWARAVGVLGFVALCVATWVLLGPALDVQRLNPIRAACGAFGWALFALGWGSARLAPAHIEESGPASHQLSARGGLPSGAGLVLALGALAAFAPWVWAWTVERPEHAVLAHAAALLGAIALVGAAGRIALEREPRGPATAARVRLRMAVGPLAALAFVAVAGLVWAVLH
jgi:hypothetical protein